MTEETIIALRQVIFTRLLRKDLVVVEVKVHVIGEIDDSCGGRINSKAVDYHYWRLAKPSDLTSTIILGE